MSNEVNAAGHRHPPDNYASQFETISGLSQWMRWLYVLLGIAILLTITFFFGFAEYAIYGVIFSLAIATIYNSYKDASFLEHETILASNQVSQLAELDDISEFLEQAEKSVFRSHIESLYTIFLTHSDIKQDNLIELLHSRLMAKNRVSELFASILITLGLIGTIVGLILMMTELKLTMSDKSLVSSDDLIPSLMGSGGALSGLDAAFYTTLFGAVFGGVILRILTSVVDANIMRYTAHLAELTEVNVLPVMRNMAAKLDASGYYLKN